MKPVRTTIAPIRVKVLMKSGRSRESADLLRRFPGGVPVWGDCEFLLNHEERDYDWLVVYDDLPARESSLFGFGHEELACPRARTLLVTAEPSTIKCYGRRFTGQFGHVLTSQEPWALSHPGVIRSQPALFWFYGRTGQRGAWDQMNDHPPERKTALVSTVCSSKKHGHTLHRLRFEFIQELRALLPEMDVFGHGVRPVDDKADALDPYRYHVAIENHVCHHHWTEKLSDAFLGMCLPFYHGCPNAADYFPAESFIAIDINDPRAAAGLVRKAIQEDEYTRRLPAIREARRRVLEEYGFFAVVGRIISERHTGALVPGDSARFRIMNRRATRIQSPAGLILDIWEKCRLKAAHARMRI